MAINAFGTLLKIGDAATPEVFTTIAEVTSIAGPKLALEALETTNHSSTDGWRERIGGLLDAGEVTFEINFEPTASTHAYGTGLIKDMVNRTKRNFKVVFSDTGATTWTFTALVTAFEPSMPFDDKLTASVTLQITGKPTLA